ncbi:hypothetical protein, partial [Klebsiella pneumoniae]|uniref:hypothetical protein n=1 Tax=Klebsiella pneumoniae TaxID=573 RepID=UPI0040557C2A
NQIRLTIRIRHKNQSLMVKFPVLEPFQQYWRNSGRVEYLQKVTNMTQYKIPDFRLEIPKTLGFISVTQHSW